MNWVKTSEQLPQRGDIVLGYGPNIGEHADIHFDVMKFDVDWWCDDATELSEHAPEYWCKITSPLLNK